MLDLGLPDGSGFELARDTIQQTKTSFLIHDRHEYCRKSFGRILNLGAEEFIPKPFHLKELLIRIKHVLQTHAQPSLS